MGKKIEVTATLAVSFDQRARGEETPFWMGRFWRKTGTKWTQIGDFSNHGCGGSTLIHPPALEKELNAMVVALMPSGHRHSDCDDLADTLCYYAEALGYDLGVERADWTLQDQVNLVWAQPIYLDQAAVEAGTPLPGSDEGAYKIAYAKNERLAMLKKAHSYAKKGKTVVRVGGKYYIYNVAPSAANHQRLRASVIAKEKTSDVEILLDNAA